MKISNETKVGALTAIAIVILILGFNFLKGKGINARSTQLYAVFPNVDGLLVSNPVLINGLQVGKISDMHEIDKNLSGIAVTISLNKELNIPDNSIASISSELLGTTSIKIALGNGNHYVKTGDTLQTSRLAGLLDKFQTTLDPAIDNINKTLVSLDMLLQNINKIFDPGTKGNIQQMIANLASSSQSLNQMLNTQTGMLAKSLNNVEAITRAFARNSGHLDTTMQNLQQVSSKLARANIEEAVNDLQKTLNSLEHAISKIDSKEGSLGLLLNDRQLYDDLRKTNRSLNTLLDDVRVNPKRYVNISVFGKKDKAGPLMAPLEPK